MIVTWSASPFTYQIIRIIGIFWRALEKKENGKERGDGKCIIHKYDMTMAEILWLK